jgi:hypothetical protein
MLSDHTYVGFKPAIGWEMCIAEVVVSAEKRAPYQPGGPAGQGEVLLGGGLTARERWIPYQPDGPAR